MTRLVLVMLAALAPLAVAQYEPTPFELEEDCPGGWSLTGRTPTSEAMVLTHVADCSSPGCQMANIFNFATQSEYFVPGQCEVLNADMDIELKGEFTGRNGEFKYVIGDNTELEKFISRTCDIKDNEPPYNSKNPDWTMCLTKIPVDATYFDTDGNDKLTGAPLVVYVQGLAGSNWDGKAFVDDTAFKGTLRVHACCSSSPPTPRPTFMPTPRPTPRPTFMPTAQCPSNWPRAWTEWVYQTASCTSYGCPMVLSFDGRDLIPDNAFVEKQQVQADVRGHFDFSKEDDLPIEKQIAFINSLSEFDGKTVPETSFQTCSDKSYTMDKCNELHACVNKTDAVDNYDESLTSFAAIAFGAEENQEGENHQAECPSEVEAKMRWYYCYPPTPEPTHAPTTCEQYVDSLLANNGCPTCPTCINSLDCECGDSSSWTKLNDPGRDCSWVASYPEKRCQVKGEGAVFAFEECQEACGSCGKACTDSTTWHKAGDETKDCAWVKRQQNRCGTVDDDGSYAYENCRKSCQTCQYC